jgi:hypothetical protein
MLNDGAVRQQARQSREIRQGELRRPARLRRGDGLSEKRRTLLKIAERPDTAANFNNVDPRSRTSMNGASRPKLLELP